MGVVRVQTGAAKGRRVRRVVQHMQQVWTVLEQKIHAKRWHRRPAASQQGCSYPSVDRHRGSGSGWEGGREGVAVDHDHRTLHHEQTWMKEAQEAQRAVHGVRTGRTWARPTSWAPHAFDVHSDRLPSVRVLALARARAASIHARIWAHRTGHTGEGHAYVRVNGPQEGACHRELEEESQTWGRRNVPSRVHVGGTSPDP